LGALRVEIREAELERIRRKPTRDLSAYDAFLRADFHFLRATRENNAQARRLAERAIELDPSYAEAQALLGSTYVVPYVYGWNMDPSLLERGAELARRALELDRFSAGGHISLSAANLARGRLAESLAGAERALELAPNWDVPHFLLATVLTCRGRFLAASRAMNRAMRLNPRPPARYLVGVGWVNLRAGREREAVQMWERARAENPDQVFARVALASHYAERGRHEEARAAVEEILRVSPDLTAKKAASMGFERFDPEYFAELEERLRSAGLP
jgi:adenylate cyclase